MLLYSQRFENNCVRYKFALIHIKSMNCYRIKNENQR